MIVASNNITLSNVNDGSTPYVHIAYANSADGTNGFYVGGGGVNLIIKSDLQPGYLNRNDGSANNNGSADFHSVDYIATNGSTVFTFSSPDYVFKGSSNHTLAMYDSNKNFLGYQSITSPTQTLSKSNTAYIRFSINFVDEGGTANNLSDWLSDHRYKLEKGSVATDWSLNPSEILTQSDYAKIKAAIVALGGSLS